VKPVMASPFTMSAPTHARLRPIELGRLMKIVETTLKTLSGGHDARHRCLMLSMHGGLPILHFLY
jgi:hypothetical protein